MSAFSSVDSSPDPQRLISFLGESARGLAAMKHYAAATHATRDVGGPILDLGCGAGHDLELIEPLGRAAVGVDSSRVMLDTAADQVNSPLVQADAHRLPFEDGSFGAAWIERLLMHVEDPAAVVREVARCVMAGGTITVYEPDWSTFTVNDERVPAAWLTVARHPGIGVDVGEMLRDAGCFILDRVEERSWWSYEVFERVTQIERTLERAVVAGVVTRSGAEGWLRRQREHVAAGTFRAELIKILWVASR